MYELKGKVTDILTPVTGTSAKGNWSKFDFVVRYEQGEYPKSICLTCFNKQELYEKLDVDQIVSVKFSIDCREYQDKFYNSISAFKVDIQSTIPEKQRQATRDKAQAQVTDPQRIVNDDDDQDLPF